MTNFHPGDLVLGTYPYVAGSQSKTRPMLILLDTGDADVLAARVTSQLSHTPCDVPIIGWQAAGLLGPSVVRLHKIATLEKTLIHRHLGKLQPPDRQQVAAVLNQLFGNW